MHNAQDEEPVVITQHAGESLYRSPPHEYSTGIMNHPPAASHEYTLVLRT